MRALLIVLAACAAEPAPPAAPPPAVAQASPPRDAALDALAPVAVAPAPARPAPPAAEPLRAALDAIPAVHGNAIELVALTDDGRAAVTVDATGAMRLWPTLDGRVEPVVVDARGAAAVALGRDGDAFMIAALDRAGALELLTVGASGAIAWRARIDEPRPIVSVIARSDGFVALTDDQRLAVFTAQGMPNGHLIPEPGERIAGLAQRGDRALALLATAGGVRGRWLTAAGWGERTPPLPIDPTHVVLSPDLARVAAQRPGQRGVVIVALATGRVVTRVSAVDSPQPGVFPVGFFDAHALAVADGTNLVLALDGELGAALASGSGRRGDRVDGIAAAGGLVAWGHDAALQLITPAGAHTLGFRLVAPSDMRALPHGFLVTDGMALVRVDDRFAERERYALPDGAVSVTPIDAHRALALVRTSPTTGDFDLVALDLDDPDHAATLVEHATYPIVYEPTARIYAVLTQDHIAVGRFEPRTATFAGPIAIPREADAVVLELVDRDDPLAIVARHAVADELTVTRARFDFATGTATLGAPRIVKQPSEPLDVAQRLVPPPRAARGVLVATVADGRLTLRDGATVRWVVPSRGITQLAWSARGELVGLGTGLAHVDLATGALGGRHCGWGFGLWDGEDLPASFHDSVCDAPRE